MGHVVATHRTRRQMTALQRLRLGRMGGTGAPGCMLRWHFERPGRNRAVVSQQVTRPSILRAMTGEQALPGTAGSECYCRVWTGAVLAI